MTLVRFAERQPMLAASAVTVALSVFITWPQAWHLGSRVVAHNDPFFSIWRLGWIAHALTTAPRHLFDANIFYPARHTLAFSDATMLQGVIAAPFLLAGVPPVLVYNVLLLAGFCGSGVAMFVLARRLTGSVGGGLVAAAVFVVVPYRLEHVMHLELQWAMWIPLAFWALHDIAETPSRYSGLRLGLFVWLQMISCVYYGVFLVIVLGAFVPILLIVIGRQRAVRALPYLGSAAVVAIVLTAPYAMPYLTVHQTMERGATEVMTFSARPLNYLAGNDLNWWWGWSAFRWGAPELHLFPGFVTTGLALAAFFHRRGRWVVMYAFIGVLAIELSFGTRGWVYAWGFAHIGALHGLRSPSRFAIVAYCAIGVLAAFGTDVLQRSAASSRWRAAVPLLVLAFLVLESMHAPVRLSAPVDTDAAPVYKVIRKAGPGVIVELPLPRFDALPGWDAIYTGWSISHWHPLVNGYSGYYPEDYFRTIDVMQKFPDRSSLTWLEARDVRYVVVHRAFLLPDQYGSLMVRLLGTPELRSLGMFHDGAGDATVFVLEH